MKKERAFTLIEILVVIAILAIVAAILFPVFSRAKAAAKKTACMSNLKQMGHAILLYMGDYDDVFPNAIDAADRYRPEIWSGMPEFMAQIPYMPMMNEALWPYARNKEIFRCPADSGSQVLDTHPFLTFPTSPSMYNTYSMSYMYRTEITFRRFSQSSLESLSDVNVLFDGSGHWHEGESALTEQDYFNGTAIEKRRKYRYNILYGDMHVKSVRYDGLDAAWNTPL
jgi:general secretion pathway protein G